MHWHPHRDRRLGQAHERVDHALKQAGAVQVAVVVHEQVHQHLAVLARLAEHAHGCNLQWCERHIGGVGGFSSTGVHQSGL